MDWFSNSPTSITVERFGEWNGLGMPFVGNWLLGFPMVSHWACPKTTLPSITTVGPVGFGFAGKIDKAFRGRLCRLM